MRGVLAKLLCVLAVAWAGTAHAAQPDLILTGGNIVTLDPDQPRARALAVRGERIVAVGDDAEIEALAGPATQRIDLGGRTVTPGINDAHVHPAVTDDYTGAVFLDLPPLGPSGAQLETALLAQPADGGWIVGVIGPEVFLDPSWGLARLDALHPVRPVWLRVFSGHGTIFNTAAIEELGIDLTAPPGGWLGQDAAGALDGRLYEYAQWRAWRRWPSVSDEIAAERLREVSLARLKDGITSIQAMPLSVEPDAFARLWRLSGAPLRLRIIRFPMPAGPNEPVPGADLPRRLAEAPRVEVFGTKWILDGTPVDQSSPLREPYPDGSFGRLNFSRDELERLLRKALGRNDQILLHVGGDVAAETALEVMEAIDPPAAWRSRRVRFEHGDGLTPELAARAAALGVVVVQNPSHFETPEAHPFTHLVRERGMSPLSDLLSAGIPLALGSDGPPNPWLNIAMATRAASRPDQALTREQALRAYTEGSAYAEFAEHEKGRLKPGYLADLAVLSQNPLDEEATPAERLPATRSLLTLIGGEIAWHDPAF